MQSNFIWISLLLGVCLLLTSCSGGGGSGGGDDTTKIGASVRQYSAGVATVTLMNKSSDAQTLKFSEIDKESYFRYIKTPGAGMPSNTCKPMSGGVTLAKSGTKGDSCTFLVEVIQHMIGFNTPQVGKFTVSTSSGSSLSFTLGGKTVLYTQAVDGNRKEQHIYEVDKTKTWSDLGSGPYGGFVGNINNLKTGNYGNLYVEGTFKTLDKNTYIAKYDGSTWMDITTSFEKDTGKALGASDLIAMTINSVTNNLYVAGQYKSDTNLGENDVLMYDGAKWIDVGTGPTTGLISSPGIYGGFNKAIEAAASGSNGVIYFAGLFEIGGGDNSKYLDQNYLGMYDSMMNKGWNSNWYGSSPTDPNPSSNSH